MMKALIKLLFLLCILNLSGCAALVATSAVATGKVATDHRSAGNIVDDVLIKARLSKRYAHDVDKRFKELTANVNEGRVLLTGFVPDQNALHDAIQIAWQVRGVNEVISELALTNPSSIWDASKDLWIKSRIKSKLLWRRGLRSTNYNVLVENGVVYLFGIADSAAEQRVATDLVRRVKGVKKLVNYVILKDDSRRS